MSENKTQWIVFIMGLLLIGWLFYFVNIKDNNQKNTPASANTASKTTSKETGSSTSGEPVPQEPTNQDRYEEKSYQEVFKETPKKKDSVERITEEQKIANLKEESDAIIAEANARIKEKNLKTNQAPPSSEELEALKERAEDLGSRMQ